MLRQKNKMKQSIGDKIFDAVIFIIMLMVIIVCAYPIYYIVVISFNDGVDSQLGGIFLWPRVFTLDNFKVVFTEGGLLQAFKITIEKTVLGTVLSVMFTSMVAYPLSKPLLIGRKVYLTIGTITMFFGGGLIPTFLLYKGLGLLDTFWVYIFPAMFNFYHVLIFISFFQGIPSSIEESAKIDGATDFRIYRSFILPLSKPVIATMALFNGVSQWNDYFGGVMYITKNTYLEPIQTYLYRIISQSGANQMMAGFTDLVPTTTTTSVKYATMVITTIPIVCVYPFLQKYFVKGMMIGAVKE
jgi:putative aldouronate transport system permease protein